MQIEAEAKQRAPKVGTDHESRRYFRLGVQCPSAPARSSLQHSASSASTEPAARGRTPTRTSTPTRAHAGCTTPAPAPALILYVGTSSALPTGALVVARP